jgi:EAL domain-containing protein (putative c-di-GMP-specific phosphodiesterase class I)
LLELISSQLDKPGIVPANICFEITETVAIGNLTCAMKFINTLRERGCRFSLDDFGSGLSSFAYLRNLAIDYLKIDGSFIRGLADDSINMTIVRSMRDIGKALGKLTVAECVEDEITLGIVRDMGFDYAQGNFLGEARPFERITGNESGNIVEFTRKQ